MKRLAAAVLFLSLPARAAELERPAAPVSSPAPAVAPMTEGVGAQLDAALAPGASLESSRQAVDNAALILQGGAAQSAAAPPVEAAEAAASADQSIPLVAPTASSRQAARVPRPAAAREPGRRASAFLGAAVVLAAALAYAALIYGFGRWTADMESRLHQGTQELDDWGR